MSDNKALDLAELISKEIIGVSINEQKVKLKDKDWELIHSSLILASKPTGYRWRWSNLRPSYWTYADVCPEQVSHKMIFEPLYGKQKN